ncbi:hypothetical protein [Mesorhizobium sp. B2-1-3A]|uniref:DUF6894 family protein n=1 Tax=Mesorhizobium sp. B2-1-3A TaxID=2589971 RepID=UPI00112B2457|nr:hypothetical protein [Mesorhizobium sp. B2-1-3A]TPM96619.1 hypothetical protein FJ977_18675 [Mesorhizobium sp. B2-1-3A]
MQIVGVNVEPTSGLEGRSLLRVVFQGEGGESVSVEMARGELVDEASGVGAIDRAKAILVQTATFEGSGDRTDTRPTDSGVTDGMVSKIYTFEYREGDEARLLPPCDMPSAEAARAEAVRCAIDMLIDLQPGNDDLTGWLVRVRDDSGAEVCTIDVAEAEAARQANDNASL